ncbi:MAG: cysteine hydrolase [Desulfobacteraceae bacterium]|nr:cysteine hydrolase [Desulfobacteraceae bacterium]
MTYTIPQISASALITIDTQNDFSLPGSPVQIPGAMAIIPKMKRIVRCYREKGFPIIHIVRIYLADGSNVDLCRRAAVSKGAQIVLPGTNGVELVSDLKPEAAAKLDTDLLLKGGIQKWSDNEAVIYKPRWGAFYNTSLSAYLAELKVNTLVFCGCNFPNCPRTSIYQASERDYRIVLIDDAISGLYDKGKEEMANIGAVLMSTQVLIGKINAHKPKAIFVK